MTFLLYSSDWLVLIASLAGLSRRNKSACSVALGSSRQNNQKSAMIHLKSGLLWAIKSPKTMALENTQAFEHAMRMCYRNKNTTKFIMGLITLSSMIDPVKSHLLSFVYVVKTREFEVFDPNGGLQFVYEQQSGFDDQSSNDFLQKYFYYREFGSAVREYLTKQFPIASEVFMPMDWCPSVGVQYLEERQYASEKTEIIKAKAAAMSTSVAHANLQAQATDFGGYCGAWSLWWLEHRLKYDPAESRSAILAKAMSAFTKEPGVPMRQWMLRYAQMLTVDTLRLMFLSLRFGGRSKHDATKCIQLYAKAKTYLQKAENIAYHSPNSSQAQSAALIANRKASLVIDPILAEVNANISDAVRAYSFGRIAFVPSS